MTRTHQKHWRAYVNGLDLSGYSRTIGTLGWTFGAEPDAALTDGCKNVLIGQGEVSAGPISAFLDPATGGLHANLTQQVRNVMFAMGAGAAPAAGDPVFCWKFQDTGYMVEQGTGFMAASLPLGGSATSAPLTYKKPWGVMLHAKAAETAVNTGTGVDDWGASPPSLGGIFVYHLFTSNGTVTLKAQEADTNSNASFADITGATSGSINAATTPQSGMIAISTTYALKRYLRWQLVLGTASTVTFAAAFIRNTIA